jgi:glycosidase
MTETAAGDDGPTRTWWKEAVVYQVYPRSFDDSDGDGVGDLRGVAERVDYLDDLGVDVVWLCPVYESPQADNGYDISDYRAIDPAFGTMADWEALRDALHERDIRLIMDLVVNHTSDEHEWFQKSRRREDGYEDYYYWRDGGEAPDGTPTPPNNWGSFMGGSAWTYDEVRGQWYLHLFDEKQPDLNWRNPAVRDEVASLVEWWLEKDIDGFRVDAINYISKPEGLPDGSGDREPTGIEVFSHGPRIHEYLRELYDRTLAHYDAVTVAEMADTTVELAADYLGPDGDGLDMIFHFEHMDVDAGTRGRFDHEGWGDWSLPELKRILSRWQTDLQGEGWNAQYLGNHDQPRIVSRFGDDETYHHESATLLATVLLTCRGTPFVYQGDEIGMTNTSFERLSDVADPMTAGVVEEYLAAGEVDSYDDLREFVNYQNRDNARTPMQWTDGEHAGFTDAEPWFPVTPNHESINVAAARADPDSVWHHYRDLVALRHETDALVYGDYELLCPDDEQFYVFTRTLDDDRVLVVLNWSAESATLALDDDSIVSGSEDATVLYANYDDATAEVERTYRPYEAVVCRP